MSDQQSPTPVTVEQLDGLLKELGELKAEVKAKELEVTVINKKIFAVQDKCMSYLKELGRSSYDSPHGKFTVASGWRVNMPVDDKAKAELFAYLKQTPGLFERYATVHSASLNAYYMREWEIAKREGRGMEFSIPGILAPKEEIKPKWKPTKSIGEENDEQSISND
jgi:hypothetical protein